ncbi:MULTISPECIES: hypothetical protein [Actinomadura]|uniref:hypothetical protein n=1 Tax=Actinomadura TaxID=1988 RepID=UPI00040458F1|nr:MULTISPECIES: hypothetical protein [Actinomadura]RSN46677.1 hypothetical protein DMH08_35440 [Actinomadura sp. WAC 06369]
MKAHARAAAVAVAAACTTGLTALPAHAAPAVEKATCSTYRSSDGKSIGVSCDAGRYYVVGTACGPGHCTTIGGPIVDAPAISWAHAGSGYFGGPIRAVFV